MPAVTDLTPYFDLLDEMATADDAREAVLLGELRSQLVQAPGARATLRYAMALGSAGHKASDPVEARRALRDAFAEGPRWHTPPPNRREPPLLPPLYPV